MDIVIIRGRSEVFRKESKDMIKTDALNSKTSSGIFYVEFCEQTGLSFLSMIFITYYSLGSGWWDILIAATRGILVNRIQMFKRVED